MRKKRYVWIVDKNKDNTFTVLMLDRRTNLIFVKTDASTATLESDTKSIITLLKSRYTPSQIRQAAKDERMRERNRAGWQVGKNGKWYGSVDQKPAR